MKPITLPVSELKPALAGLSKIISRRVTLPVLGCVHIERNKEGKISLTGTDLDRSATVTLEAPDQGEPMAILVPLEDLTNVTKSAARTDALELTRLDQSKAVIRFPVAGNTIEHQCDSLPVEEFPEIDEFAGNDITIDTSLREAIHDAFACSSDDQTRQILNGAYLDVSRKEGHYVVGTDGRHLFSSNSFKLELGESLIVPSHPFLSWKGFNEDGDWCLRVKPATKEKPQSFELTTDHWRFVCRSFEGEYPNWRHVLPDNKDVTGSIKVAPEAIESLIQTIVRLPDHDPVYHGIGIQVEGGEVSLLAKSAKEQSWNSIKAPGATASGKAVKLFINRHLLLKAIRFGLKRMDFIDSRSPIRFSEAGRQMIVMPIRGDSVSAPTPTPAASESPANDTNPPPSEAELTQEERTMPETNGNTHPTAANNSAGHASEESRPPLDLALAQVEAVRGDLRKTIASLGKLSDSLKQAQREQKSNEKEISSVRQTLRSLQSVRI